MFVLNFFAAASLPLTLISTIVLASMDHDGGLMAFLLVIGTLGLNLVVWGLNALKQEDEMEELLQSFQQADQLWAHLALWKQAMDIWAWMAQEVERDTRAMARYHVRKFWEEVQAALCLQQLAGE